MSILGRAVRKSRRLVGQAQNKLWPGAIVLAYHRVADLSTDPQLLCVRPKHFKEQLEVLRDEFSVVSLRDLVHRIADRKSLRRLVTITFDDGYADNLWNAKPLLETHQTPATIFVTSGYVDGDREFWWDEMDRLLERGEQAVPSFTVEVNGSVTHWPLTQEVAAGEGPAIAQWNVLSPTDPTPRERAYRQSCELLRPLSFEERCRLTAPLRGQSGPRQQHKILTQRELQEMASDGLIEIGAHTVTHPLLSNTAPARQQAEIEGSKARLEEILGRPVYSFSYPYGNKQAYTDETVGLVRSAGYESACSNFEGHVRSNLDRYQIPRYLVRDWGGDEFSRQLRRWLHE